MPVVAVVVGVFVTYLVIYFAVRDALNHPKAQEALTEAFAAALRQEREQSTTGPEPTD